MLERIIHIGLGVSILTLNIYNTSASDVRYAFKNFTVKDGLSENVVTALFQDKYGFLWIGTNNGLNMYDG